MAITGRLKKGSDIRSAQTNEKIQVHELLGSGGQGEVYRVHFKGKDCALKWFFDETASPAQRRCIENLVRQGQPSSSFLWPLEIAVDPNAKSFGYLMELRDKRFQSFDSLVSGKIDPSFDVLMTVGLNLVESFHSLHAMGLCYRDINFGNGFFDLQTGEVLICDNDNVAENHTELNTVLGTPDFIAPEIVTQKALPSRNTDYFSLSVLLFYLFHIQHPLVGKKILKIRSWDLPAREMLFGTEPVFIFDPTDKSNEAVHDKKRDPLGEAGKNAIPYWNLTYPEVLKKAFLTSFTEGILNPDKRLSGSQWRNVLSDSKDSIFLCPSCNRENFFDSTNPKRACWSCKKPAMPQFLLQIQNRHVALYQGLKIAEYQIKGNPFDPTSTVLADVIPNPSQAGAFGLRNRTTSNWSATVDSGKTLEIPAGKSIPLHNGTEIRIGNYSIRIVKS